MDQGIMEAAVDLEKHLVEVPYVARDEETCGVSLTELETPCSDCLVRECNAAHR
jgi:hypothetical protein